MGTTSYWMKSMLDVEGLHLVASAVETVESAQALGSEYEAKVVRAVVEVRRRDDGQVTAIADAELVDGVFVVRDLDTVPNPEYVEDPS